MQRPSQFLHPTLSVRRVGPRIFPRRFVSTTVAIYMQDHPGARKLILVVDDEKNVADTLALVLKMHDYDTASAHSAEEAIALCTGLRPDAVISDVIMGKMNGIELAYHLSATIPDCRVLLMSGNVATDTLLVEWPAAAYDFPLVSKPFHPREVLDLLADLP